MTAFRARMMAGRARPAAQLTRAATRFARFARPAIAALAAVAVLAGCAGTVSGHGTPAAPPPTTAVASSAATSGAATSGATASTPPSPTAPPPSISFTDCTNQYNLAAIGVSAALLAKLRIDCGTLEVPLDYDHPDGRTIDIGMVRIHYADQPNRIGSLLLNPGGPGGSGVFLALGLVGTLSTTILEHFDLIGFDPRGVGVSSPVECISDATKDRLNAIFPDVRTAAGFAQAKQAAADVAAECEAKLGPALADYNTVYTARDMDQIRAALGEETLNYLGFSYGTRLGTVYAHLFPTRIRVAVLDGAVNPETDDITSFANQLAGFEDAFDQFAADCRTRPACAAMGDPRQTVYDLVAKANATPIPTSDSLDSRTATGSIVLTGVLSALYDQGQWSTLGQALISAQKGDAEGLFELADEYNERNPDGTYTNIDDANTAISCNDAEPGPTDEQIKTTTAQWVTKYPMFGLWAASSLFSCQQWQPNRHLLPPPSAAGSKPILVIGTIHDPATPYHGAQVLADALGTGVLLTWDGQGHTAYGKSDCIDTKVDYYLVNGTVPAA
ncbi:MAG: alpha/beta hydrolase, partial [Actinomycetia bacterium]|nr:alpha/beta hydrolase [Actinomycetes bacterium]